MPTKPRQDLRRILAEAAIRTSGWVTSAVVLLLVFFLFREGLGLFGSRPVNEEYQVAVGPQNGIAQMNGEQLRAIHEQKIVNWKELGGADEKIFLFNLGNLDKHVKSEDLGTNFSALPQVISSFIAKHPGILIVFPARYMPADVKVVEIQGISLGDFVANSEWYPTADPSPSFGALPLILGTFWVTLGAIALALPLALAVSIYLSELASDQMRNWVKPMIELLAGIPSVVYGFFGLVVVVPQIQQLFNLSVGETALAGSTLLALIALPTIITVSEDALRATPRALREASLALGATHWQTIWRVTVPYAFNGISAATILGVGRAVGETMTVLMVTGNAAVLPTSFLLPVRTLSATIAAELGEAPQGGLHYKALFMVGCTLFIITFAFNLLAEFVAARGRLARQ